MFNAKDIAGYQGKEIELWAKPSNATGPNGTEPTMYQIRGAQNFNPSEEQTESKVSELGYDAQKTIYGATSFTISTSLLVRDLVQIARLSGIDPTTAKRLVVSEFAPVNCINWIKDPDALTETIIATVVVTGYKPRTASKAFAVEANATITLDGSADDVITVDGKANVREHLADGSCTIFFISDEVSADTEVYAVENPGGQVLSDYDGYTYTTSWGTPAIQFDTAPDSGSKVRIVHKVA